MARTAARRYVSLAESFVNLLQWAQPWKTAFVLVALVLAFGCARSVPLRWVMVAGTLSEFQSRWAKRGQPARRKRPKPHGTPADWAVNFVASVPDTKDLEGVFASRHRAYLDDAAVLPATLVHQHVARFAGVVSKTSSGPYGVMRKKWQRRYVVVSHGLLTYWDQREDAALRPPKGRRYLHRPPRRLVARDSDEDHAYSIADAPHGYPRAELVVAYFASSWQGGPVHKHFLCGDDADESEKLRNAILSEVEAAE